MYVVGQSQMLIVDIAEERGGVGLDMILTAKAVVKCCKIYVRIAGMVIKVI